MREYEGSSGVTKYSTTWRLSSELLVQTLKAKRGRYKLQNTREVIEKKSRSTEAADYKKHAVSLETQMVDAKVGVAKDFLGVGVERDREEREKYLIREDCTKRVVSTFVMKRGRPVATPMAIEASTKGAVKVVTPILCQELTGSLLFLRQNPDVSFAVVW
ncbi:hypothetical protein NDN08_004856 [Rhodosorus marinus]|uniref:Uncharacterized protein n=1 Tax=Rhodosorus marinus TaxID=101924 RepID=A0AAV8UES4_9RHOD|nr:hypothetical protein NDN08_004856 [Rhodosorus marinus]